VREEGTVALDMVAWAADAAELPWSAMRRVMAEN